jgi:serine/threonine protein kinase
MSSVLRLVDMASGVSGSDVCLGQSFVTAEAALGGNEPSRVHGPPKKPPFMKRISAKLKSLRTPSAKKPDGSSSPPPAAPAAPVADVVTVDDFDLLQVVGKGAFGKVFLVRRKQAGVRKDKGQVYAMKVLLKSYVYHKNQVEHTQAERRILEGIDHPFLVRLRFAFQTSKKLYMIMDYYAGGSLFFHLRQNRKFDIEQARFYAAELCCAMQHLHSLDIVYRDVKLENILMDKHGHVHITDFGLSKEGVEGAFQGAETFCGTAEYVAPELLHHMPYGKAADWWSYGILVFEMIVGKTPFFSKNRNQMFKAITQNRVSFPQEFPLDGQDFIAAVRAPARPACPRTAPAPPPHVACLPMLTPPPVTPLAPGSCCTRSRSSAWAATPRWTSASTPSSHLSTGPSSRRRSSGRRSCPPSRTTTPSSTCTRPSEGWTRWTTRAASPTKPRARRGTQRRWTLSLSLTRRRSENSAIALACRSCQQQPHPISTLHTRRALHTRALHSCSCWSTYHTHIHIRSARF